MGNVLTESKDEIFVVTGDRQLRAAGHKQVVILTPREFLDRLPEPD
jgi:hypothetical protein